MAELKLVDAEKLDSDLGKVATAIRGASGTTDSIPFPDGFVSSVKNVAQGGIDKILNPNTEWGTLTLSGDAIVSIPLSRVKATHITLTNCKSVADALFFENSYINTVRLCSATEISTNAFACAYELEKLIIETPLPEGSSGEFPPCVLEDMSALSSTLVEGWATDAAGVYVPPELVDLYSNDSNWCNYPIYPIPDKNEDPDGYNNLYGGFEEGSE